MLGDTPTTRGRVREHCPVCILQARGGGAIPEVALSTIERFVAVTRALAVELPTYTIPCLYFHTF